MNNMFDWFTWAMGLLQGTVVAVISGVLIFLYFIPKMMKNTAKRTIEELKKDPEIKTMIDKAKEIVDKLHPLADQFKNIDLEQIQQDFRPLYEAIKKIDTKDIEGLIKNFKELTGTVTKALEKPKVPEPLPEPD
jgi:hypothetical protein